MKSLKFMISAEEAKDISNNKSEIDIKVLCEQIESDLIEAEHNNFIEGEEENLLSNIKEDIIKSAVDGNFTVILPGINHSKKYKETIVQILEEYGFIVEFLDSKCIKVSWD